MNLQPIIDKLATLEPDQFNMNRTAYGIFEGCGTAACIGGWATVILNDETLVDSPSRAFEKLCDVPNYDAIQICYPFDYPPAWLANPAQAIALLEHYRDTQIVDWAKAMAS
jgi:hypothetical protein